MVLGQTDTGKSTLTQYLLDYGLNHGIGVGVIDSDIGQATFGPPTCLSLSVWKSPHKRNCSLSVLKFVGSFNPSGYLLQIVVGVKQLVDRALHEGVSFILVDTCGLVLGRVGFLLKQHKIQLVRAKHLILLQKKKELEGLLNRLWLPETIKIYRVPKPLEARRRSPKERRDYRVHQLSAYFQNSKPRWIHFSGQRQLLPGPPLRKGGLVGLYAKNGETLGLGLICRRGAKSLEVISPLSTLKGVQKVESSHIRIERDVRGE